MKIFRLLLISLAGAGVLAAQTATPASATAPAVVVPSVDASPAFKPIDWKADPTMTEYARQAGSRAIAEWVGDFVTKTFPSKRYAVFPLGADLDDHYFTTQVKTEFANRALGTEYSLYTREDPEWDKIVENEIKLGDQVGDTMQKGTIQEWGRQNGVQGGIRGRITGVYVGAAPSKNAVRMADDAKMLQVRISLQAYEIETGRLLWGAEKVAAVMLPDDSLVVPGTKRQWILYGVAGFAGLVVLLLIFRALGAANRPR
ncbi:MAG: hypothetical protein PSU94_17495 [Lacunisphaera sp.]|nr:hypothetical protein [Lacunisphaera sp.]